MDENTKKLTTCTDDQQVDLLSRSDIWICVTAANAVVTSCFHS